MHGTKINNETRWTINQQRNSQIWNLDDGILFEFGIMYDAYSIENIIAHRFNGVAYSIFVYECKWEELETLNDQRSDWI